MWHLQYLVAGKGGDWLSNFDTGVVYEGGGWLFDKGIETPLGNVQSQLHPWYVETVLSYPNRSLQVKKNFEKFF